MKNFVTAATAACALVAGIAIGAAVAPPTAVIQPAIACGGGRAR